MDDKRLSDERAKFVTKVISKTGSALCCDNPDSIALSELGVVLCDAAEHIDILTAELAAAREEIERLKRLMPEEPHCKGCGGMRVKNYPNTGVWTGARIAGQAFTVGICNECWGSGRADRPAMNLRELLDDNKSLRTEIERLKQPTTCSCGYCDKMATELSALKAAVRIVDTLLDDYAPFKDDDGSCVSCGLKTKHHKDCQVGQLYDALSALVEPEVKDGKR